MMALAETSYSILKQKRDESSITGQQSVCKFHLGLYFPYHIEGVCGCGRVLNTSNSGSGGRGLKASPVALFS